MIFMAGCTYVVKKLCDFGITFRSCYCFVNYKYPYVSNQDMTEYFLDTVESIYHFFFYLVIVVTVFIGISNKVPIYPYTVYLKLQTQWSTSCLSANWNFQSSAIRLSRTLWNAWSSEQN